MADSEGKVEVEMVMDTFNLAMGGRLREGNVYPLAPEFADHLMAQGLARKPTRRGRQLTQMTEEEEIADLESRLAALRGHEAGGVGSMVMGSPVSREPAPTPPGEQPAPVVRTSSARSRTGIPGLTNPGESVGEPTGDAMDLTGEVHPGTGKTEEEPK